MTSEDWPRCSLRVGSHALAPCFLRSATEAIERELLEVIASVPTTCECWLQFRPGRKRRSDRSPHLDQSHVGCWLVRTPVWGCAVDQRGGVHVHCANKWYVSAPPDATTDTETHELASSFRLRIGRWYHIAGNVLT